MLKKIHESANIHPQAMIADNVKIGPYVVVGKGASVGEGSHLIAHIIIEDYAEIAKDTLIYPFVSVSHHCIIKEKSVLLPHTNIGSHGFGYATDKNYQHHYIPQIGNAQISKQSYIGPHANIDRAALSKTSVGENSYIGPYSHLAHNVEIGKHSRAMQGLVVAGSTKIGDYFSCYGKVGITGHKKVGDNIRLKPFTGLNNNEEKAGTYQGFPHQKEEDFQQRLDLIKNLYALASLAEENK